MEQIVSIPMEDHRPRGINVANLPYIWFCLPGRQGFKLMDMERPEIQTHMLGGQDSALQLVGGVETIKIVIHWPGYREFNEEKRITVAAMTRSMLAYQVARKVMNFIWQVNNFQTSTKGGYKSSDRTWRIGPNHINLGNVGLIGMRNSYHGYWKVDLYTTLPVRLPAVPRPLENSGTETSTNRQNSASGSGTDTTFIHYIPPSQ